MGRDDGRVYSMLNTMFRNMGPAWRNPAIIQEVCAKTKTRANDDRRFAALYALMLSKTKQYQIERFLNLWVAFNGYYGYLSANLKKHTNRKQDYKEEDQIRIASCVFGWRYDTIISRKEYDAQGLLDKTEKLFLKIHAPCTELLNEGGNSEWEEALEGLPLVGERMEAKAYILLFCYKVRCHYFHGDKPLPIIGFSDELLFYYISQINDYLETLLDAKLPQLFDTEQYQREITPRLLEIAETIH